MTGRGKFFLHGGGGPKLRKFDLDNRFFFYDGRGDFGPGGGPGGMMGGFPPHPHPHPGGGFPMGMGGSGPPPPFPPHPPHPGMGGGEFYPPSPSQFGSDMKGKNSISCAGFVPTLRSMPTLILIVHIALAY